MTGCKLSTGGFCYLSTTEIEVNVRVSDSPYTLALVSQPDGQSDVVPASC